MDLSLTYDSAEKYKSHVQIARIVTEKWALENLYCPRCGEIHLSHFPNNMQAADFFCQSCHNEYELKSRAGGFGKKNHGRRICDNDRAHYEQQESGFFVYELFGGGKEG